MNDTTNAQATNPVLDNGFITLKTDVSKKVAGQKKQEKVGEMVYFVPTLEAAGLTVERELDKDGKEVESDDGLPVYKSKELNWIMGAIHAAVKAQARNKLVSGTATLKDGAVIAADWDKLTAESERGGNADALAAIREVKQLFAAHVAKLGKSQKAQDTLNTLFKSKESLALQSAENKQKMEAYISEFADTLNDAQVERYSKYLTGVSEACASETEAEDF